MDKLIKCLHLPKGAKEELGIAGEEGLTYDSDDEDRMARARKDKLGEDELDEQKEADFRAQRYQRKMNAAMFGEGFYHMIPSFYRTLNLLKKQKREFSVVFHSQAD